MSTIIPTYVYTEMTPNPASMKFVADRMLIEHGEIAEYNSMEETVGSSDLANQLFQFPFVKTVFVMSNFITITKIEGPEWYEIKDEIRSFIQKALMENQLAVQKAPEIKSTNKEATQMEQEEVVPSEFDDQIKAILDEYVRPAVEKDGGAIDFKSFSNGTVTVILKGSCSGCPSSTVTLKNGVQNLLQSMIPQVTEVVAHEM